MKKKQSPVLLIVMGIVVVVGLGLTNTTNIWEKLFTPPPKPVKSPENAPKVDTSKLVGEDVARRKATMAPGDGNAATGIPDKPSIFLAKFKRYDPSPNETSTNSLWYDKEHQQQERQEELDKKKGY